MPVRWGDLDALNHVNNTVYFRFFEEARMQLLEQAQAITQAGKTFVLAHTSCDFIRPLHYPATAIVLQTLTRVGRSSLEFSAVIEREGEPGVPYAKGRYIVVGVDAVSQRPAPWEAAEIALLSSLHSD
ncbi:acyl-CoA thioesterase [Allopusillimonas ginsengisoli]|uniref:acyl-CoA thioesterase n=1 Tax=Allopusillimonas ginsengisoli TaxID=453575 RepID=UPI001FD6C5E7|nr:thioesterase family protein [Allopusillimonas ginsengisoli]